MKNKNEERSIGVSISLNWNDLVINFNDEIKISKDSSDEYVYDLKKSILNSNLRSIREVLEELKSA